MDQHRRAIQSCRRCLRLSIIQRATARIKKITNLPATHRGHLEIADPRTRQSPRIPPGNHFVPAAFDRLSLFSLRLSAFFYFHSPPHSTSPFQARLDTSPNPQRPCIGPRDATAACAPTPGRCPSPRLPGPPQCRCPRLAANIIFGRATHWHSSLRLSVRPRRPSPSGSTTPRLRLSATRYARTLTSR